MRLLFRKAAQFLADAVASPPAFLGALVFVLLWLAAGPSSHYSDSWQLIINTSTSVLTFLMVFLIQNTQNRDTRAIQLKLDELLRSVKAARTELVTLEDLSDDELGRLREEFAQLAAATKSAQAPAESDGSSGVSEQTSAS